MPKLSAGAVKMVDAAEARHETGGSFEPLTPGRYVARLSEVTVQDPNKHGAAVWNAEFQDLTSLATMAAAPGRQWLRLTLPSDLKKGVPATYTNGPEKWDKYQSMLTGLMKGFFESFGYTSDSDTDELLGEYAVIEIGIRTIQSGAREGEKTNEVKGIFPLPEDLDLDALGINAGDDDEAF